MSSFKLVNSPLWTVYISDPKFRRRDTHFAPPAEMYWLSEDKHKARYWSKRWWFVPRNFQPDPVRSGLLGLYRVRNRDGAMPVVLPGVQVGEAEEVRILLNLTTARPSRTRDWPRRHGGCVETPTIVTSSP